jgi:hypothetical protein
MGSSLGELAQALVRSMKVFRQLWRFLKGQRPPSDWTVVQTPEGSRITLDRETVEYIQSEAPQPNQRSLDTMLELAKTVRVIEGGASAGRPLGKKILLEIGDASTLDDLRQLLRIIDRPAGHCMCHGNPAIEFLDKSGTRLAVIGLHHGNSIRWNAWKDDAELVDGFRLLEWLAAHGVQYPLQEHQASNQTRAIAEAAWERWFAAMPPCLRPLLADQREFIGMVIAVPSPPATPAATKIEEFAQPVTVDAERLVRVKHALEEEYPDNAQRAQVLFRWYGQGGGAWSSFAAYEEVPEYLLMDVAFDDVVLALQGPSLPQPLLEGAARFLAGWNVATRRSGELECLPAELRRRLLEHSLDTEDADRRARAEFAFRRR